MKILYLAIVVALLAFTAFLEIIRRYDFTTDDADQKRASEEKRLFYSSLLITEIFSICTVTALMVVLLGERYIYISLVISAVLLSALLCAFPTLAKTRLPESFAGTARSVARVFSVNIIAKPFSVLGEAIYKSLTKRKEAPSMTQDELMSVVDTLEEEGDFDEAESEIIKGAIKFSDITAQEVMIPRVDVKAFDINDRVSALAGDCELLEYSRIPIYRDTIDDIIGILPTKLFIKTLNATDRDKWDLIDIRELLRDPYYIHMSRDLSSLLKEFREEQRQMAIVVDEYGGTMGIVTAEDIVEEIVGDIFDESDDIEREYIKYQTGYEVDGLMSLDDFRRLVEHSEEYESDYNTVGGWCAQMLGKIPEEGDSFDFENLTVTVTEMDDESVRAKRLMVEIRETGSEDDEDDQ